MRSVIAILATFAAPWSGFTQSYTASPLAGGALPANVLGTSALLGPGPQAVAVDAAGNVFLAARGRLDPGAGNETVGFSGDNGKVSNMTTVNFRPIPRH